MNKVTILLTALAILVVSITGCSKDEKPPQKQTRFLVDKIYNYQDKLIGDYMYDDNNRLIRSVYRSGIKDQDIDYEFKYDDDRVSIISVTHINMPGFNHEVHITYNALGQIVQSEIHQQGTIWGKKNYRYHTSGQPESISDDNGEESFFPDYEGTPNVMRIKCVRIDPAYGKTEYYKTFTYDNHPKPDFGVGNIFQIEMLPYFGNAATMESYLSKNNMTSFINSKWIYTYNSDGLPATIESKFEGIEYDTPALLKIKYRQVDL